MKLRPIPILLYHEIGTGAGATPPNVFREHMAYLRRQGITSLTLPDFEAVLTGTDLPEKDSVLITFDDGDRSCLTEALPILEEFNLQATAFLITGRMAGSDSDLGSYRSALSWDDVRALQDSGIFSLQSHSHTHSHWSFDRVGQALLREELRISRETLANELASTPDQFTHLAWPWGRCSHAFESIAAEGGFKFQYLVQKGAVTHAGSNIRLPRLCCDGMSTAAFVRWIDSLTNPYYAQLTNGIYGVVRLWRHGMRYR